MDRKHGLMYVLSAIVILNVVAILFLNNRLAEQEAAEPHPADAWGPSQYAPDAAEPVVVSAPKPLIRTLVLKDVRKCPDCFDITQYVEQLAEMLNMSVDEANPSAFKADILPAIAFNQTLEEYPPEFTEGWDAYGYTIRIPTGEYAGTWYVLPTRNPPYLDTRSSLVYGRVTVTYITMGACTECYDVGITRAFLEESRITPYAERTYDASSAEGKALIQLYGITAVPTILLSKETDEYANLRPGWPAVGTIEEDGTYVLRNLQRLGVTYYDLDMEKVMRP